MTDDITFLSDYRITKEEKDLDYLKDEILNAIKTYNERNIYNTTRLIIEVKEQRI